MSAAKDVNRSAKLRVLFIALEFPTWQRARHWSYTSQLGIEEGLRANGVEYLTITTPWLSRAQELCAGKHFDQVWIEIVHHDLDEAFLDWVANLAPVRVGLIAESLEYYPDEYATFPILKERRDEVERRLPYLTHVLAIDENDVNNINVPGLVSALWWPAAVPERFIGQQATRDSNDYAVFCGALYGERANWLELPELQRLLVHQRSPEDGTVYPILFDKLHGALCRFLRAGLPGQDAILPVYLYCLRRIRRDCFALWLKGLQSGCAVINLPSFVKGYPGRVVEGMAAGRPVISWEIPDRPQNKALFEDGKEILLYPKDDPAELASQVKRILAEPDFTQSVSANAHHKILHFHTIEKRVCQILHWIETGETPTYV